MGVKKSCTKFRLVTIKRGAGKGSRALRCETFRKGLKHPVVPSQGLKDGGRSQNYIRPHARLRARSK